MEQRKARPKSAMGVVRRNVSAGGSRLWTYADFASLPPAAVSQALSRLSREGVLQRVRKGVYHKPEQTVVGPSRPRESAVVFKVLGGRARPTGPTAANVLGFSTQTSPVAVYAVSAANKPSRLEGARVIPRRPELPRSLGAEDAAILEILRDRGRWAELSPEETVARMQKLLREEGRYERLARAAEKEPPRVRAMLGALGETIGAPEAVLRRLRQSLNPLSKFEFGVFRVLPNAKEWQGKIVEGVGPADMSIQSVWEFITDVPDDAAALASGELASLLTVWEAQRAKLKDTEQFHAFNERLAREWAIETGILERLYDIDRGVTQLLIEKGLDEALLEHGSTSKPPAYVIQLIKDQRDALEGLFDYVAERRPLSTAYIKELHHLMVQHQTHTDAVDSLGRKVQAPLIKGDYKKLPNNPARPDGTTCTYCPPEHVAAEMDRLIEMHHGHRDNVPVEIAAAWLHHRFTQIHPFQDGNGRIARSLASLVFIQAGLFPLVVRRDDRIAYISALEEADAGDLKPLVDLFVKLQTDQFKKAIRISEQVLTDNRPLDELVGGVVEGLRQKQRQEREALQTVFRHAELHEETVLLELEQLRNKLLPQIRAINSDFGCVVDRSSTDNDYWWRSDVVETARRLHYYANTQAYRSWVRLRLFWDRTAHLVFSFHGAAFDFEGVMACSAFVQFEDEEEEGDKTRTLAPVTAEPFLFYYSETQEATRNRFAAWLKDVMVQALSELQRNL